MKTNSFFKTKYHVDHIDFMFLFIFLLILFQFEICNSQVISYERINVYNGLPSDIIYDIKIDSKGYMWVITDNGVLKFDGIKKSLFNENKGLLSKDNYKIIIDSMDNVWLYSNLGISKIDKNSLIKSIHRFEIPYYNHFLINNYNQIFFNKISETGEKHEFTIENDKIVKIESECQNLSDEIGWLLGFKFIYNDTLYHTLHNNRENIIYVERFSENKLKLTTNNFGDMFLKESHNCRFDQMRNTYQSILLAKNEFKLLHNFRSIHYGIWPDGAIRITDNEILIEDDNLFIPLDKGLYWYKIIENKLIFNKNLLPNMVCTGIAKDFEGNYWISTIGNGLIKIPSFNVQRFEYISEKFKSNPVLVNGYKNESVLVALNNGIGFNLNKNQTLFTDRINHPKALFVDEKDVFVGGNSAFYVNDKLQFDIISVKSISDMGNKVAILTFSGIVEFHKKKSNNINLMNLPEKHILKTRSNSILYLGKNFLVGNQKGLFLYYTDEKRLSQIHLNRSTFQPSIYHIHRAKGNTIWASSESDGVFLLKNLKLHQHFKKELLDPEINSLKIDEKDNVWVATKKGINKIYWDGHQYQVSNFTSFHGLPSDYVFDTYCYNDTLYAATNQGLVVLDVCALENETFSMTPPVYIQDVRLLVDRELYPLPIDSTVTLKHEQNDISIQYTGISYRSNGNIRYEYRLLPAFENWRSTANDNITFNDLKSGKYTFEVRAINAIGTISEKPALYEFTISKHYTETTWFRALSVIFVLMLVGTGFYLWFNYKRRKEKERLTNERQISELKLRSLQSQMNPHFIFNSLNAIQQFINVENKKAANDYLSRFARLMRLYLTGSDTQFITLEEEMAVISLYCSLEHLRFSDKFSYTIDIEEGIDLAAYLVPAMLLQPHVENAIRHGLVPAEKEGSKLIVQLSKTGQGILCLVEDNGIGRSMSNELKSKSGSPHRSMGNKISKERLDLIRSLRLANIEEKITDLTDAAGNALGTRVEIAVTKSTIAMSHS